MSYWKDKRVQRADGNEALWDLGMIKSFLRVGHDQDDALLTMLLELAITTLEDHLSKTFLDSKITLVHDNNRFVLPYGPVQKVERIVHHKDELDVDRHVTRCARGFEVHVPFTWKDRYVEVTYVAGYGPKASNVPIVMRHKVLEAIQYCYDRDVSDARSMESLEHKMAQWLGSQRYYEGYLVPGVSS